MGSAHSEENQLNYQNDSSTNQDTAGFFLVFILPAESKRTRRKEVCFSCFLLVMISYRETRQAKKLLNISRAIGFQQLR